MPIDANQVALVLLCAEREEALATELTWRMKHSGRSLVVSSGVDEDPAQVQEHVRDRKRWGLFFACESVALDGPAMARVEAQFNASSSHRHVLVRLDISHGVDQLITSMNGVIETFCANNGRFQRQRQRPDIKLRERVILSDSSSLSMPVVRLAPEEALGGDTARLQLPDIPMTAELIRRRKAIEARNRNRNRSSAKVRVESPERFDAARDTALAELEPALQSPHLQRASFETDALERRMVFILVGAGLVAILAALVL